MKTIRRLPAAAFAAAALHASSLVATADPVVIRFDTELVSMTLTGSGQIPLARDQQGVEGYGFVTSSVTLTLSSQRANPGPSSLGGACASTGLAHPPNPCVGTGEFDGGALNGTQFQVDSFFDVFFDITLTDIDPNHDFYGQSPGASLSLFDNGPVRVASSYATDFVNLDPQFGLWPPPESAPFVGSGLMLKRALGVDINGNGEEDVLEFTLLSLTWLDAGRTFIQLPDGTVVWTVDAEAALNGAVMDASVDPPFSIGDLVGPTTGTSRVAPVPEPGTLLLVAGGLAVLRRRRLRG